MKADKIFNENCLNTMAKMPESFIDLCVTSPPYDSLRKYDNPVFDFEKISAELFRVIKKGGILVWIVGDATIKGNETGTSFKQALGFKETGFNLFDTMIYAKVPRGAVGNNTTYWQSFEYMFVFSKGKPKTINLIRDRKNKESRDGDNGTKRLRSGERKQVIRKGYSEYGRRTNIWEYHVGKGHSTKDDIAFEHPAIFPEKLAEDHILSWSNPGDLVYDPFMGSGTTAKMALLNNRKFIGSEISEKYYQVSLRRIKEYY
jgi:DNA modification methylase